MILIWKKLLFFSVWVEHNFESGLLIYHIDVTNINQSENDRTNYKFETD